MNFYKSPKFPSGGLAKLKKCLSALTLLGLVSAASASALAETADFEPLVSLKTLTVPEPSNLDTFVKNKAAAIALGKALFWDQTIGSDGENACATCHFSAGADNRLDNQLAPKRTGELFHQKRPNETLKVEDFPFVKFSGLLKNDRNEAPTRYLTDVVGSQGIFFQNFISGEPGAQRDNTALVNDPVFNVNGLNIYRVSTRNTPTVINTIFNLRNAWDGRTNSIFNGANSFGKRDPEAGVYVTFGEELRKIAITINDASLASQATGPIVSNVEMNAVGRIRPDIGRRVLPKRMLEGQTVAPDDSVLGQYRAPNGDGLPYTYKQAVEFIFNDRLWNSNKTVNIDGKEFSQIEANFPLFYGLAVQLYEATLVSDETPFDRFAEGDQNAMSEAAIRGLIVFEGKGKCISCHGGALFNGVPLREKTAGSTKRLKRLINGDGNEAIFDNHFYNIGVTRTEDDLGAAGNDPFGNPLSFARLAQKGVAEFYSKELDIPNLSVSGSTPVAVEGAFKTPTLRNVALTAPYFHNGGYSTLRQVVEFFNRGGDFPHNNSKDLAPNIEPLGLTDQEMDDLVTFMEEGLTDPRVKKHAAPFDHPGLEVTDSFVGDGANAPESTLEPGTVEKIRVLIPPVGKDGYANNAVPTFTERLGDDHHARTDYSPEEPTENWVKCANEGGICKFNGVKEVRFVLNGKVAPKTRKAYGLTFCLRHMYGLPFVRSKEGVCEVKQ